MHLYQYVFKLIVILLKFVLKNRENLLITTSISGEWHISKTFLIAPILGPKTGTMFVWYLDYELMNACKTLLF